MDIELEATCWMIVQSTIKSSIQKKRTRPFHGEE